MVQPLPCHPPAAPPPADALSTALARAPLQGGLPASVARCHARAAAPARDLLLAASAAAAPRLARTTSASTARTAARASAGYAASAVASAASSAVKAATKKTTSATTKKKSTGALAFLDDKSLTTEEKLMRLLVHLQSKWQKDIEKRLKEIAAGTAKRSSTSASSGSSSKGGGGLLGSVVKAASSFVPGVASSLALLEDPQTRKLVAEVSGPVIAAGLGAAGFPALAPLALQYAPQAVDALAGLASSAGGAARTGSSSSTSSSSGDLSPDAFEKIQLMELQRVMEHQKELFSMVSNLLRGGHELRMNVIQNVR